MSKSYAGKRGFLASALFPILWLFLAGSFALWGQSREKFSSDVHDPAVPPRAAQVVKWFEDQGFILKNFSKYVWKWALFQKEYQFQGGRFEARAGSYQAGRVNRLYVWIGFRIDDPGYDEADENRWLAPDDHSSYRGFEAELDDDEFKRYVPVPGRKIGIWVGRIMSDAVAMMGCGSIFLEARGGSYLIVENAPDAAENRQKILDFHDTAIEYLKQFQGKLCAAGLCRCAAGTVKVEILDGNPLFNDNFDFTDQGPYQKLVDKREWQERAKYVTCAAKTDRVGAAADGVSLLILRTEVTGPGKAVFSLPGSAAGALYTFAQGHPLAGGKAEIEVDAFKDESGDKIRYRAAALYLPPKYSDFSGSEKKVKIGVRYKPAEGQETNGSAELRLTRPPVVLVHGTFDNPEACWNPGPKDKIPEATSTMRKLLVDEGFRVFSLDWSGTNGQKNPSSFFHNRKAVWENPGGIKEALELLRQKKFAATQVDVVAHSQGGLIVRNYARGSWGLDALPDDDPHFTDPRKCAETCGYHRKDNFAAGDIHRLITISTTHYGSDICGLFAAYAKLVDDRWFAVNRVLSFWEQIKLELILCMHPQRELKVYDPREYDDLRMFIPRGDPNPPTVDIGPAVMIMDGVLQKFPGIKDYAFTDGVRDQVPSSPALVKIGRTPIPAHAVACTASDADMLALNKGFYQQRLELIWSWAFPKALEKAFQDLGRPNDAADLARRKTEEDILWTRVKELEALARSKEPEVKQRAEEQLPELQRRLADCTRLNAARLRSAVFGNDENDCTVRKDSSLGGLKSPFATVLPGVLHGPAPQFPSVQKKVLELLKNDGSLFDPKGFGPSGVKPRDKAYTGPAAPSTGIGPAPDKPGVDRPGVRKGVEEPAKPDVPGVTEHGPAGTAAPARLNPDGTLDIVFVRSRLLLRDGKITVADASPWEEGEAMIAPGSVLLSVRDLADDRIRPAENLSLRDLARILNTPDQDGMVVLKFAAPGGGSVEIPHPGSFRSPGEELPAGDAETPPPAALDALIRDLGSPTPMVVAEAAVKLGEMGEAAVLAAPALVKLLGSRNDFHFDGVDAQGRWGGGVVSPRAEAWKALAKIGRAAVPALIDGLKGGDYAVAILSAEMLGGFKDPRAIEPLRKVVASGRAGVSDAAARALAAIERNR